MISGLHSCRAGNEPQVGQVKSFVVQQMTGKSGKPYTKIKAADALNGGLPYKILSAKPTGHTDSYGNISFNIEIEPANGAGAPPQQQQSQPRSGNSDDRSNRIERQHSQSVAVEYAKLKGLTDITTDDLRALIDWFERDVNNSIKTRPPELKREPEPEQQSDEEPF